MRKARESARSDIQEQTDETSSHGAQPTAIIRPRGGAHHTRRSEAPADNGSQAPPDLKPETSRTVPENASNGSTASPEKYPRRDFGPPEAPPPAAVPPPVIDRRAPAAVISETGALNLKALKGAKITELAHIARDYNIDGAPNMRKQEMIFSILQAQAQRNGSILGE